MGDSTDLFLLALAAITMVTWARRTPQKIAGYFRPTQPAIAGPAPSLPGVSTSLTQALADTIDRKAMPLQQPLYATPATPDDITPILRAVLNRVQAAAPPGTVLLTYIATDSAWVRTNDKGARQIEAVFLAYEVQSLTTIKIMAKIVVQADGAVLVLALGPYNSTTPDDRAVESKCERNYAEFKSLVSPII